MAEAIVWGSAGSITLIIGALTAMAFRVDQRLLAMIMAFGAGVLISAIAFDLTENAYELGGGASVALGLVTGGLVFFGLDYLIDRKATPKRKHSGGHGTEASARAVALGAGLDALPEAALIGLSFVSGDAKVSIALIAAVILSNYPEGLGASVGFIKAGRTRRWILTLWIVVLAVTGLAAGLGYALLSGASSELVAITQAFGAGALLVMLSDSMIPEAFEFGGPFVGVMTAFGFASAFLLSTL